MLLTLISCLLLGADATVGAAGESMRVTKLEAELAAMRQQNEELMAKFEGLSKQVAWLQEQCKSKFGPEAPSANSNRDPDSIAPDTNRRLSGHTYTAVRSWQVHEFPSGHTCPAAVNPKMSTLLPKSSSNGEVSWTETLADSSSDLSFVSVAPGWSTTEVQSMPAPLKVVHAADCSSQPTLNLPLDTTMEGNLNVESGKLFIDGHDVNKYFRAGWYVGGVGDSCDAACASEGLVCDPAQFAQHAHEVDECKEVWNIIEAWRFRNQIPFNGCNGCVGPEACSLHCCSGGIGLGKLELNSAVNDAYEIRDPSTTQTANWDCSYQANGADAGQKRPLCFCNPQGVSSLHGPYQL